MAVVARACGLLLSWAALVSAQSTGSTVVVEISPVVHQGTPFSALLRLPPSLPLKKGGVEVAAFVLDGQREEIPLATKKFVVSGHGEVLLEHELGGLLIGCVGSGSRVGIFQFKLAYYSWYITSRRSCRLFAVCCLPIWVATGAAASQQQQLSQSRSAELH